MKKLLLLFISIFSLTTIKAQCTTGINSLIFAPIEGTTVLQVTINSSCCEVHYFEGYTNTSDASGQIITLCFVDTGLLLPTTITSTIVLAGLNTAENQNFIINAYFHWGAPGLVCSAENVFNPTTTLTLETPLTVPRTFLLSTDENILTKTSLFPNPNSGSFSIDLPADVNQVQLSIVDICGKEVYNTDSYFNGNTLQLKGLSKGLYFAKIVYNQTTKTLKFIVD